MSRIVAGMTMSLDGFVHDSRGSTAALATLIQVLLRADAVDELEVDIMPVLLRRGLRLFENLEEEIKPERIRVDTLPRGRTALSSRYAVENEN